ncbi:MAG: dienelactone hydrolase [Actinobacteria bacterium HGW-Actinobacteria-8]|nr:MAG: dienelactone hydrolase [Actinobacteria bacterium HGW-Actinobacteria-8]
MTHIVLFHSGLGLTRHVLDFADVLRGDGHDVTTPDLYDGEVFDNLADGVVKRDAIGIQELSRRGAAAVEDLPRDLVYLGFSLGAASAQALAFMRPGALGVVLMHACLPPGMLGIEAWPGALKAQIHWAEADPWVDAAAVDALADLAPAGACERFEYPGGAHLFAFDGYEDYDTDAAALMTQRVRTFVAELV